MSVALAVAATPVAVADVTGLSPSSATVDPGRGASATVRIRSEAVSCLTVRSSSSAVTADAHPNCGAGDWTSTLTVETRSDTAPGTYTIRIFDSEGGEVKGADFTVRVREPKPATTATTSTTASTTTTTRRKIAVTPTTNQTAPPPPPAPAPPPPLDEPPPGEPPPVTGAPVIEVPADAFASVERLIAAGIPEAGLFFPLDDPAFRSCLPLTSPCGGRVNGLVLIPARTSSVVWRSEVADELALDVLDLPLVDALQPVGTAPEQPASLRYVLPVLDFSEVTSGRRGLVRVIDGSGRFVQPQPPGTAPPEAGATVPVVGGPFAATTSPEGEGEGEFAADDFTSVKAPLGRPEPMRSQHFTEAAPAVVASPGDGTVVYGLRPAPGWDIDSPLVPLFTAASVPYLVRRIDGPPGLFVATAEELLDAEEEPTSKVGIADEDGNRSALAFLAVATAVAVALTGAAALIRRRSSAGRSDSFNTPRGT